MAALPIDQQREVWDAASRWAWEAEGYETTIKTDVKWIQAKIEESHGA